MSAKYDARVADISEIDEIFQFEQSTLERSVEDEQLRMFLSWKAPWRREALEFYLPKGWCFAVRENNRLVGYFLAQPLIFFRQLTQTLWIEHVSYENKTVGDYLLEIAFKTAREKHIQSVFVSPSEELIPLLQGRGAIPVGDTFFEFQSTRLEK
jgi:hypothetical protein